jgi:hypothetical protein
MPIHSFVSVAGEGDAGEDALAGVFSKEVVLSDRVRIRSSRRC